MTMQYEIDNNITWDTELFCVQSYTNTDGMIFLLPKWG